jgi:hypothetical protein
MVVKAAGPVYRIGTFATTFSPLSNSNDEDSIEASFFFLASGDFTSSLAVSYCHVQQSVEVEIDFSSFLAFVISI